MPLKATEEHALTNLPLLDNSEPICTGERSDVCVLLSSHHDRCSQNADGKRTSASALSISTGLVFSKVLWNQRQNLRGAAPALPETTAPPLAVAEADAEPLLLSRA